MTTVSEIPPDGIAVVGMSGRFPGAPSVDRLWDNLVNGVESIQRFGADDLLAEGISPSLLRQPDHVSAGGALDDVDMFDAGFFGFSPREAEILDPQHRLFLECAWEALEHAGHPPARFPGLIGVYAGAGATTHLHRLLGSRQLVQNLGSLQITIGNEKDHLSTRTAYKLGLRGPAITVQTTCSTSLVAVSLACSSLLSGQCDLALAGGTSVVLPQRTGYTYRSGGIMSPDGHCRAFDTRAAGAVGGNGVGVVALRRLVDAIGDGDDVLAVILGSAINNDGGVKVGYTAPSIDGQAAVIRAAHAAARVTPTDIAYVEAHGTGTSLGDPIEVAALTEAFGGRRTDATKTCLIGSIKTNIGHLDAAAGVTGLIKVVMALGHRVIPPSLHFTTPNPELHLDDSPFAVVDAPTPWPPVADGRRRVAGVSSFGIGGTNAHLVVAEAPGRVAGRDVDWPLLVVSARTAAAADRACCELATHLELHPEISLSDAACTLQRGRQFFRHRRAVVGADRGTVTAALRGGRQRIDGVAEDDPDVAFLLPGQGSQRPGMGSALYRSSEAFRAELDACCDVLTPLLGRDLRDLLIGDIADPQAAADELNGTELAQPALLVVQLAVAAELRHLGIRPAAMLGHSLGEVTAACLAGVLTREDAVKMVAARGRLMGASPTGAMLAIPLGVADVAGLLPPRAEIAATNAASTTTVSGTFEAIDELTAELGRRGIAAHRLRVSHAFHSASMDQAASAFVEMVGAVQLAPPTVPYLSNVTGDWITAERATDPRSWGEHVRATVRFADGAMAVREAGAVLLELGPDGGLCGLVRQAGPAVTIRTMHNGGDVNDARTFTEAIGRMWVAGVEIDWAAFGGSRPPTRVALPTYPFERSRYWIEAPQQRPSAPPQQRDSATPATTVSQRGDGHGPRKPADQWIWMPSWRRVAPAAAAATDGSPSVAVIGASAVAAAVNAELNRRRITVLGDNELGDADVIVDLRALRTGPLEPFDVFDAALELVRSLAASRSRLRQRLVFVTDRAVEVTGAEAVRPELAVIHGLARVVSQEHSRLATSTIDIALPDLGGSGVAQLVDELLGVAESSVSLRNGHRWLPGFTTVPDASPPGRTLPPNGSYLIAGGLGRIGLTLADRLATPGACIALVSRTELPPRRRWADEAKHGGSLTAVLTRLEAMERAGARVLPIAADVADAAAMGAALERIAAAFGPLDGVVHAAGAVGSDAFAPIVDLQRAQIMRHFTSKVAGAGVLADLLGAATPPLAQFTSSLSSELGGTGFGAYAAANAYLDAYASGPGRGRWTSVAWEGWNFTGSHAAGGLAALALTPDEGATTFTRLAGLSPQPRLLVSTGDIEYRVRSWVTVETSMPAPTPMTAPKPVAQGHPRPDLRTAYAPPAGEVETAIATAWQDLLGVERIGRDDDFFELGGHSLLAIQLISRLRDTFGVEVSLHAMFDAPTVGELAVVVHQQRVDAASEADRRLAELLDLVEGLSEEEVEALLTEQGGGSGDD